jgi:hypothetical protein
MEFLSEISENLCEMVQNLFGIKKPNEECPASPQEKKPARSLESLFNMLEDLGFNSAGDSLDDWRGFDVAYATFVLPAQDSFPSYSIEVIGKGEFVYEELSLYLTKNKENGESGEYEFLEADLLEDTISNEFIIDSVKAVMREENHPAFH